MSAEWYYADIAGMLGYPVEEATLTGNTGYYERPLGAPLRAIPDEPNRYWTDVYDFLGNSVDVKIVK